MSKQNLRPGQEVTGTYRQFDDSRFLAADDLSCDGKPVTLTITDATAETVTAPTGSQRVMPCLHFKGTSKLWALNKTNGRTLTRLFGTNKPAEWVGQSVRVHRVLVRAFGDPQTPCIRVYTGQDQ